MFYYHFRPVVSVARPGLLVSVDSAPAASTNGFCLRNLFILSVSEAQGHDQHLCSAQEGLGVLPLPLQGRRRQPGPETLRGQGDLRRPVQGGWRGCERGEEGT